MAAQELIVTPIADYHPLSAFDAAAFKVLASPELGAAVLSIPRAQRAPEAQMQLSQASFLRKVEQVRSLCAAVI